MDSPQELDARFGGSGTLLTTSETEDLRNYVRGRADSRVRSYALRLFADSLREAGKLQFGENFNLDSALTWSKGTPVRGQVSAVVPLAQGQDNWGSFLQPGLNLWTDDLQKSRRDLSIGYVARRRVEGYGTVGGSLFLDRSDYGHQRASLGAEWRGGPTFVALQLHQPLTGAIRTPDGRYEGVLAGWSAAVRRSVGQRLDFGFESTTWRDPGNLDDGKTIGQAVALGTTHSATVGYQASPALRLYGGYSRNRLAQGEHNNAYELGFEYRLIGERQKLSAAGDEDEGKIYNPIRNRPLISMGVYALTAFALTDVDEDKGGEEEEAIFEGATLTGGPCPQDLGACVSPKEAVVQLFDVQWHPLPSGSVARDATFMFVQVELPRVSSPVVYRLELSGSAVPATEYEVVGLHIRKDDGGFVPQTDPADHFRVPAGEEVTLVASIRVHNIENIDESEIVMRLVPVKESSIGTTAAVATLDKELATGVITARIPLAANGTGEVGRKAVHPGFSLEWRVQRDGTIITRSTDDSASDSNPNRIRITSSGTTLTLEGEGEDATDSDNVTAAILIEAVYSDLGDDEKSGGTDDNADTLEGFPAGTQPIKAYVRLEHSEGASEDSYELAIDTATNKQRDVEVSGALRKISSGFWEVPLGIRGAGANNLYTNALTLTAKDVRSDGQKVKATIDLAPVEVRVGETITRVPALTSATAIDITLNSNYVTAEQAATITFVIEDSENPDNAGVVVPYAIVIEPTATAEGAPQTSVDVNIPVEITYPTARGAQQITIPLSIENRLSQILHVGKDFTVDLSQQVTTVPDGGTSSTDHTANLVVKVLSDAEAEISENFFLAFGDFPKEANMIAGNLNRIDVTIYDTPPDGEIYKRFESIMLGEVNEPATGTADATLTLNISDLGTSASDYVDVKVRLSDAPNSATPGTGPTDGDYYVPSQDGVSQSGNILTIRVEGDTTSPTAELHDTKEVTLKINSDDLAEGRENIRISMVPSDSNAYQVDYGSSKNAIAPINDADAPFFRLSAPNGLEENRDDGQQNIIRLSSHTSADASAPRLKLNRSLIFNIDAGNAANDFDTNNRLSANDFPERVRIPAGASHTDIVLQIANNDEADTANTFTLNRVVADATNIPEDLLSTDEHRGLGANGITAGTSFTITDDDKEASCADDPTLCPVTVETTVQTMNIFGSPYTGPIPRSRLSTRNIVARVKLSRVPKATVYRVDFGGTALAGTDYILRALYVTQEGGEPVRQTNPSDHFRVPAGGAATLEAIFLISHIENVDASEILLRLVPVEESTIGTTAAVMTLETEEKTGEIKVRIPLAALGTGKDGPAGFHNARHAARFSLGTATATLEGEGANLQPSDPVKTKLSIDVDILRLNSDGKYADGSFKSGFGSNMEPEVIRTYIRLTDSAGAEAGRSYKLKLDPTRKAAGDTLRKVNDHLYDLVIQPRKSGANIIYTSNVIVTAKDVRATGEKVTITLDPQPVRLKSEKLVSHGPYFGTIPAYPRRADDVESPTPLGYSKTEITFNSNLATEDPSTLVALDKLYLEAANLYEPTAPNKTAVEIPVVITYPTAKAAGQTLTIPLVIKKGGFLTDATAERGADFNLALSQTVTTTTSDGTPRTEHTANLAIEILSDDKVEDTETILLELGEFPAQAKVITVEPRATEVIINDKPPAAAESPVIFYNLGFNGDGNSQSATITEPATSTTDLPFTVLVSDMGTDPNQTLEVQVRLSDSPNGATLGTDSTNGDYYLEPNQDGVSLNGNILTITIQGDATHINSVDANSRDSSDPLDSKTVNFKIRADDLAEGTEIVTATVLESDDFVIYSYSHPVVSRAIIDNPDDTPWFRLSTPEDTFYENPADPSVNTITLSSHVSADDNAARKILERPMTFKLYFAPAVGGPVPEGRVSVNNFKQVTIPAGASHIDIPFPISDDSFLNYGSIPTAIIAVPLGDPNPGLVGTGEGRDRTPVLYRHIADDDLNALELRAENGSPLGSSVSLQEGGNLTFVLKLDEVLPGTPCDTAAVTISAENLGSANKNAVTLEVLQADGTPFSTPLTTTDGTALSTKIPTHVLTNGICVGLVTELPANQQRLLIKLTAAEESFTGTENIVLKAEFAASAIAEVYDKSDEAKISQTITYLNND